MTGGPNHAVRGGADYVAKGGEQLQENGLRLGLGVRGEGPHGMAGEAVERVLVKYRSQGLLGLERPVAERRLWFWCGFRRVVVGQQFVPRFHFCESGLPQTHLGFES